MQKIYEALIKYGQTGTRVVYWNMLVPRKCPGVFMDKVEALDQISDKLFLQDEAFFYSKFVVEEIKI